MEDLKVLKSNDEAESKELSIPPKKPYNPAEDGGLLLSGMLLGFSIIVIGVISYLLKKGSMPESLLKVFGTVLIIVAAVFLIVTGYSEKQIAPTLISK